MVHDPFHGPASTADMSPATLYSSEFHQHSRDPSSSTTTDAKGENLYQNGGSLNDRESISQHRQMHNNQQMSSTTSTSYHINGGSSNYNNEDNHFHTASSSSTAGKEENLHRQQRSLQREAQGQHHHGNFLSHHNNYDPERDQRDPPPVQLQKNTRIGTDLDSSFAAHKEGILTNDNDKVVNSLNEKEAKAAAHHQNTASKTTNADLEPATSHLTRRFSPEMLIQKRKGPKPRSPRKFNILGSLSVDVKNHIVAVVAEFAGTFMFLFFAFGGTQVVNGPANAAQGTGGIVYAPNDAAKLLYISLSFGMSLMVTAWVFFRISGGLFNPAVTLGLAIVGVVTPLRAALVGVSQILGGMAAAAVVDALTPGTLNVNTKLLTSDTAVLGVSLPQGLFMEMFMTAQLVFTVFMLAAEKHRATFIAPVGIGLSLFIAELMSVYYTGGSLNPARSFGPSVVEGFRSDHWVYWVGPILGAFLASGFYSLAKAIKYETVNPGQDEDGEAEHQTPRASVASTGAGQGTWGPSRHHGNNNHHKHDAVNEKASGGTRPNISGGSGAYADGPALEAGRA